MTRIHRNDAKPSELAAAVSDTADTIELTTVDGWPDPGSGEEAAARIRTASGDTVELVTYTGIDGTTLTGVTRDAEGDTPAQDWDAGATVEHVVSAGWLDSRAADTDLVDLADTDPAALGTADAGQSSDASRADHVHEMPDAGDVGADPEGKAASAVSDHEAAADPHPDYLSQASAKATYASHVGTATAPITSTTEARPHSDDGMVIWFTDYSESGDEPDNMEPQDLQVRVDEAEA